ncbi:RloB family protein [Chitinophaga filiformis]|uniref:RloB family protein n=1 Tax=Chitinophaga filiformis TaxID=104663 RepID=A0ABY4I814_CHIFI|nr:RloB family protein [Chitinophaga filiformis]UPK71228.1 RloB family protein [Chitinophaga filiformis]
MTKNRKTQNRQYEEGLLPNKQQRRNPPSLKRAAPFLTEKPTILIVCEGENTEPSYFRKFRLSSATIKAVGDGRNTVAVVKQAIELSSKRYYEQVWCVFDKDDFPARDFNSAVAMAAANNIKVGYSNQAFEYWLILHFADHQGGKVNRKDYHQMINTYIRPLGISYNGKADKQISEELFDALMAVDNVTKVKRVELAISRAKRNYKAVAHLSPAEQQSVSTVFRLVEEIQKYA